MRSILFICHGNICRSTMAQCVFTHLAAQRGCADRFFIDSAAVSREELGNPIYPPARRCLQAHGVPVLAHRARQITPDDYDRFDRLIAMDGSNLRTMLRVFSGDPAGKCSLLLSRDVADPWYTGDFEATWRDVLTGCTQLLDTLNG